VKAWIASHRRSAIICGATLLLPLLLYLKLALGVWAVHAGYVDEIQRLEPRIARLQGLRQVEGEMRTAAGSAQQQRALLVYPASAEVSSVAAAMQSDIRQLLAETGLSVSNSQLLPVREEEKFDYIGIKLTVAGDMESLDRALAGLARFSPRVFVEAMDVWPTRQSSRKGVAPVQQATATLRLFSLRAVI
jgi:general secretion pathway protein M